MEKQLECRVGQHRVEQFEMAVSYAGVVVVESVAAAGRMVLKMPAVV